MMTVYGVPGWGSAISELMLTLANIPYHFVNVAGFDQPGPQRDSLLQLNPLCQVPTLRLNSCGRTASAIVSRSTCGWNSSCARSPMRWGPRRAWFMAHTPKFVAVADKVYQRPELRQVLRDNELI